MKEHWNPKNRSQLTTKREEGNGTKVIQKTFTEHAIRGNVLK